MVLISAHSLYQVGEWFIKKLLPPPKSVELRMLYFKNNGNYVYHSQYHEVGIVESKRKLTFD
jgi:hypothetical protein